MSDDREQRKIEVLRDMNTRFPDPWFGLRPGDTMTPRYRAGVEALEQVEHEVRAFLEPDGQRLTWDVDAQVWRIGPVLKVADTSCPVCELCGAPVAPDSPYYESGAFSYCSDCCSW